MKYCLNEFAAARVAAFDEKFKKEGDRLPPVTGFTNCHIHSSYSFSPYSPSDAVWNALSAGLATAGIMDHDSVSGAYEFLAAGEIAGLPVTVGCECRVSMKNTPLNGKRINNPDQKSVAYVALHGIPHQNIAEVDAFFAPYRKKRDERNRKMCAKITGLVTPSGLSLDYDGDVIPLSRHDEGGSVTERHILFALTKKITAFCKIPEEVVDFLENKLGILISAKVKGQILAGRETPSYYEYDILGALKSALVEKIYVDADEECPDVTEFIALAKRVGAIPAYAYLGDVTSSVTGDKKAQKFEDDYLDLLMKTLKDLGFLAVTYMPSRNTPEQLERIMRLCREYGFFEISGEDINSPRQSFICSALAKPECAHLAPAAFALIGHENQSSIDLSLGMFSPETLEKMPELDKRIKYFSDLEMNK